MWEFNYGSSTEIAALLERKSLAMSKKFGQNFLFSNEARSRIVSLLGAPSGSCVWEIGPGAGSITSLLLKSGVKLTAFEIDHGFCALLRQEAFKDEENFILVEGDALKTLFMNESRPDYICGNLPYNVGSVIIARLIENSILPSRMVFTLQKEVVERMCARPGDEQYSSFSILTQADYENTLAFCISRNCFYPKPNVDSAVVLMTKRSESLIPSELRPFFLPFIRQVFSQRRKTVRNNLSAFSRPELEKAFSSSGLSGNERAEALSFDQLVSLASALEKVRQKQPEPV